MSWLFSKPDSLFPAHHDDDEPVESSVLEIVETAFDGCAWCGDGEGVCAMHAAELAAQADAYHAEKRAGRR